MDPYKISSMLDDVEKVLVFRKPKNLFEISFEDAQRMDEQISIKAKASKEALNVLFKEKKLTMFSDNQDESIQAYYEFRIENAKEFARQGLHHNACQEVHTLLTSGVNAQYVSFEVRNEALSLLVKYAQDIDSREYKQSAFDLMDKLKVPVIVELKELLSDELFNSQEAEQSMALS